MFTSFTGGGQIESCVKCCAICEIFIYELVTGESFVKIYGLATSSPYDLNLVNMI